MNVDIDFVLTSHNIKQIKLTDCLNHHGYFVVREPSITVQEKKKRILKCPQKCRFSMSALCLYTFIRCALFFSGTLDIMLRYDGCSLIRLPVDDIECWSSITLQSLAGRPNLIQSFLFFRQRLQYSEMAINQCQSGVDDLPEIPSEFFEQERTKLAKKGTIIY